nr:MAG TPA: hypothetical protein [Caudoviricetes sp.]
MTIGNNSLGFVTVSPGSSCSCSAVAISGTVLTAGCSTRMAGTICRMLGGTTAVANRVIS